MSKNITFSPWVTALRPKFKMGVSPFTTCILSITIYVYLLSPVLGRATPDFAKPSNIKATGTGEELKPKVFIIDMVCPFHLTLHRETEPFPCVSSSQRELFGTIYPSSTSSHVMLPFQGSPRCSPKRIVPKTAPSVRLSQAKQKSTLHHRFPLWCTPIYST